MAGCLRPCTAATGYDGGVLVLLSLLLGCPNETSGATYPAAALYRLDGAALLVGTTDAREGTQLHDGEPEEGHDWSLVIEGGDLWVGLPDLGEVWRWSGGEGAPETVARGMASEAFGAALAVSGGTPLVGAPDASGGDEADGAGAVALAGSAARRVVGSAAQMRLGEVVAACGDLDGDERADVAMVAPWARQLGGGVYTVPGESGATVTRDLTPVGDPLPGEDFGAALSCSADLVGDGAADLVVGAPFAAGAGGVDGEGTVTVWDAAAMEAGAPAAKLTAHADGDADAGRPDAFGSAVATCQFRSSGRPALVVGAPLAKGGLGEVAVFFAAEAFASGAIPQVRIVGTAPAGRFGATVACADRDGDALEELFVGAPGENAEDGTAEAGALYAFGGLGTASGTFSTAQARFRLFADRAYLRTGSRFAVGDLDGDDLADLVLLVRQR